MGLISATLRESFSVMKKDKWILFFSIFPALMGIGLFSLFGHWLFTDVIDWAKAMIEANISSETWGAFFNYALIVILSVGMYVVISFSFVLVVSLIASPFNDIISSRVESIYKGKPAEAVNESFARLVRKFWGTLINESKKVSFILILTVLSLILSFIPFVAPLIADKTAILIAINFLDYSWSRNDYSFGQCLGFIKNSFFVTTITGFLGMFFMSIPVVNVFALPFCVIYFTILFLKKSEAGA